MATRISDAQAERIAKAFPALLDALASGDVMAPHYKAHGTTADQVRVWRLRDPECVKAWDAAREQSADAYDDQIVEVVNSAMSDSAAARVKIQGLQWLAGRRNAARYGDRTTHDVTIKTIDLTSIIHAANARLAAAQAGRIIDAEVIPKQLEDLL